jgi:hypothetical protein
MSEPDPAPKHRAIPWPLAFAAGVVLAVVAGYLLPSGDDEGAAPPVAALPERATNPVAQPPAAPPAAPDPAQPVDPSTTIQLSRDKFPESGPVSVSLRLHEPSADATPRPVRIVSVRDQRVLETEGRLDDARSAATIEVDPEWLQPGPYLVEVKTTESSPLPLRRYVIVVR